jgi:hypothetical protein
VYFKGRRPWRHPAPPGTAPVEVRQRGRQIQGRVVRASAQLTTHQGGSGWVYSGGVQPQQQQPAPAQLVRSVLEGGEGAKAGGEGGEIQRGSWNTSRGSAMGWPRRRPANAASSTALGYHADHGSPMCIDTERLHVPVCMLWPPRHGPPSKGRSSHHVRTGAKQLARNSCPGAHSSYRPKCQATGSTTRR